MLENGRAIVAGRVVVGVVVARSFVLQRVAGERFRALLSESPLRESSSVGGSWGVSAAVGVQYVTVKLGLGRGRSIPRSRSCSKKGRLSGLSKYMRAR